MWGIKRAREEDESCKRLMFIKWYYMHSENTLCRRVATQNIPGCWGKSLWQSDTCGRYVAEIFLLQFRLFPSKGRKEIMPLCHNQFLFPESEVLLFLHYAAEKSCSAMQWFCSCIKSEHVVIWLKQIVKYNLALKLQIPGSFSCKNLEYFVLPL